MCSAADAAPTTTGGGQKRSAEGDASGSSDPKKAKPDAPAQAEAPPDGAASVAADATAAGASEAVAGTEDSQEGGHKAAENSDDDELVDAEDEQVQNMVLAQYEKVRLHKHLPLLSVASAFHECTPDGSGGVLLCRSHVQFCRSSPVYYHRQMIIVHLPSHAGTWSHSVSPCTCR